MALRIVTDSTADLPEYLVKQYEIGVIPLNVHFGEEVFRDGVDIRPAEYYHRLKSEPLLPNTSQPAPGEFLRVYRQVAAPGDTIISIHLSAEFSGTIGSARIAAEMLADEYRIFTVDSRSATLGLGLITLEAARLAQKGVAAETVLAAVDRGIREIVVDFTVTSLEHLSRTGRIGKASSYLGSLLNIKPLLTLRDGIIVPVEKIRGNFNKVANRMVDDFVTRLGSEQPLIASVVRADVTENTAVLQQLACERLNIQELIPGIAGPVIGTHTGPNLVGLVALPLR